MNWSETNKSNEYNILSRAAANTSSINFEYAVLAVLPEFRFTNILYINPKKEILLILVE